MGLLLDASYGCGPQVTSVEAKIAWLERRYGAALDENDHRGPRNGAERPGRVRLLYDALVSRMRPHTRAICDALDAVVRNDVRHLAIFLPPRCGKTTILGERFPAYLVGKLDRAKVMLLSYSLARARESSRASRAVVEEREVYPFAADLRDDAALVDRWQTTSGAMVSAAGVLGSITGFGANYLIVDDPVKDAFEAASPARQDAIWKWFSETVRTRLEGNAHQILAMTRWSSDDLGSRVAELPDWTTLRLPWYAETQDPLGRDLGAALWPQGNLPIPIPGVEMSTRAFEALYQQRPAPRRGQRLSFRLAHAPVLRAAILAAHSPGGDGSRRRVEDGRRELALGGRHHRNRRRRLLHRPRLGRARRLPRASRKDYRPLFEVVGGLPEPLGRRRRGVGRIWPGARASRARARGCGQREQGRTRRGRDVALRGAVASGFRRPPIGSTTTRRSFFLFRPARTTTRSTRRFTALRFLWSRVRVQRSRL